MAKHHKFKPTMYHLTLGSHKPVLRIRPGDSVTTSTVDASGCDATGKQVVAHGNAQTGPFYIEGAEPGDTLAVYIDCIEPNRDHGYSGCGLSSNVIEPQAVAYIPGEGERSIWHLNFEARQAVLQRPRILIDPFILPFQPMLGCFGVAPEKGQAIAANTAGNYGGNMDYRRIQAGTMVYLPVFVPGALFHLGDAHVTQADGEILGRGIEVSADVTFTVDIVKKGGARWPRGENDKHIFTIGNARPLQQALQHATTEMVRWLQSDYNMDALTAHMFLGQYVRYEVGNVFNPAYTMVCMIAKKHLPTKETTVSSSSR